MDLQSSHRSLERGYASRSTGARRGAAVAVLLTAALGASAATRAQGYLDQLGTHDPWARLEGQDAAFREQALADALRTADRSACGPLFALYRAEPASSGLRPDLVRAFGALGCRRLRAHLTALARLVGSGAEGVAAIEALGRLRDPASLPLLVTLASTGQAPAQAVASLRRFGDVGLPALHRLARGRGPAAAKALAALAELRAPGAAALARQALASGAVPPAVAIEAIGRIGGKQALPTLLPWLSHRDAGLRRAALEAVARLADPRCLPALLAVLAEPELRALAARTLARLGAPVARSPLISLLPPRIAGPGRRPPGRAESAVIRALGRTGGALAVSPLAALLSQGSEGARGEALDALQYTGSPVAARLLRRVARRGGPLAPRALLRLGSLLRRAGGAGPGRSTPLAGEAVRALPELRAFAAGRDPRRQAAALRALGRIGDPAALPALRRALGSPHAALRRAAVAALGDLEADEAVPLLAGALARDADPVVRAEAAWALGRQRSALAVEPLLAALRDPGFAVAPNAAAAVGALGIRAVGARLPSGLTHSDPLVRANVALAMARLGYRDGRARLLRLAREDRIPAVRAAAALALARGLGVDARGDLARLRDRELDPAVERALEAAQLEVAGRPAPASPGRAGPWFDLRLESGAGAPVAYRAYLLRLPDGSALGGVTDGDGFGLLEGAPPGAVDVEILTFALPPRPAAGQPASLAR